MLLCLAAVDSQAQLFEQQAGFAPPAGEIGKSVSVQQYLAQSKDLQGEFTQIVNSPQGKETSSGVFKISKPGKFYWDYQSPDRQKIISNGKKVWQYDLDLEQISVRKSDELVGDVAVRILTGQTSLDSQFIVTAVPTAQAPIALQPYAGEVYRLTPKKPQEGYDSVYAVMKNGAMSAIAVDAGRGQQTVIVFKNVKRNVGIPASVFEFTPPQGVDVIGG